MPFSLKDWTSATETFYAMLRVCYSERNHDAKACALLRLESALAVEQRLARLPARLADEYRAECAVIESAFGR